MPRAAFVLMAALAATAPAASAQSADQPSFVFTIYGGMNAGAPLWQLSPQGILVTGTASADTMTLGRRVAPGLIAGLAGTYYRSPHFGITGDVGYFGLSTEQRCSGPATWKADSATEGQNRQLCATANGYHAGTGVIGFMGGVTYRLFPDKAAQPFVRVTAGLGLLSNSYVETVGVAFLSSISSCNFGCGIPLIREQQTPEFTWLMNLSAGATISLSPTYRFRFEARDLIVSLPVVTGPKDPFDNSSFVTTGRAVKHIPIFLFGLDVHLERKHTRRY
jgi:hypothetical protein